MWCTCHDVVLNAYIMYSLPRWCNMFLIKKIDFRRLAEESLEINGSCFIYIICNDEIMAFFDLCDMIFVEECYMHLKSNMDFLLFTGMIKNGGSIKIFLSFVSNQICSIAAYFLYKVDIYTVNLLASKSNCLLPWIFYGKLIRKSLEYTSAIALSQSV